MSYTQMVATASVVGVEIRGQGLEQRFGPASVRLMKKVLEKAVGEVIEGNPAAIPVLSRFEGVYIRDSSVVSLPLELQEIWPGVGGSEGETAAVKLQTRLDYKSGRLGGPVLQAGRAHDTSSPYHDEPLPEGALRMGDLGFFDLDQFAADSQQSVYWLSRYKTGTTLYDENGQRIPLLTLLRAQHAAKWEMPVRVGGKHRLSARLFVVRVPQEVADQRRRRLHEYARKKQVTVSEETLALADWTLILTNIPSDLLSISDVSVLIRIRWQIELLFRLWKSLFLIDESQSKDPYRILTELYAKLLAVVIVHWTFLINLWHMPNRSLWKAASIAQSFAITLAFSFHDPLLLQTVLWSLDSCFRHCCRINPRRSLPNTYQLLLALDNSACVQL